MRSLFAQGQKFGWHCILTFRGYAQPCVAPAARLRIGAVMHWHGLLTINYDYETNTKKANKRMGNARKR